MQKLRILKYLKIKNIISTSLKTITTLTPVIIFHTHQYSSKKLETINYLNTKNTFNKSKVFFCIIYTTNVLFLFS